MQFLVRSTFLSLFTLFSCGCWGAATLNLAPAITLSDPTEISSFIPTAAISDNNDAIVAWLERPAIIQAIGSPFLRSREFRGGVWTGVSEAPNPSMHRLLSPWVSMDGTGNAALVWIDQDGFVILASTLAFNSTTWASPAATLTSSGNLIEPEVISSTSGSTISTWATSGPKIQSSSLLVFSTNTWEATPEDVSAIGGSLPHQLAMDPSGVPFSVYRDNPTSAVKVAKRDGSWSIFPDFAAADSTQGSIGFDSAGNATLVWAQLSGGIYSVKFSTLAAGAGSWAPEQLLQANTEPDGNGPMPQVAVDPAGNAVAIWIQLDGGIHRLFGSTRTAGASSWTTAVAISAAGRDLTLFGIGLGIDGAGDAVAVWSDSNDGGTTMVAQAALLSFGASNWQLQSPLSSTATGFQAGGVRIAVNSQGNLVIAWALKDPNTATTYTQAITGNIVVINVNPPSSIEGEKKKNRFALQSEFFNRIKWGASPTPDVVSYRIYRNGSFLAQVSGTTFEYTDQGRGKNEVDTYGVSAVNADNQESTQIQVTVK